MRSLTCAALALTVATQAAAQQGTMASSEQSAWSPSSGTMEVSSCAMSQQDGEAVLSATIITGAGAGGGPHVKRSAGGAVTRGNLDGDHDSLNFSWSWGQSNSGALTPEGGAGRIVPTVTAHAIKTKGAGGVDRVTRQACAPPPLGQRLLLPAVHRREAKLVATCDVSGDPAMPALTIQMPLSAFGPNAKTGHVSLIKREASVPSVSERHTSSDNIEMIVVATCSANARGGATYDLAVGKKI